MESNTKENYIIRASVTFVLIMLQAFNVIDWSFVALFIFMIIPELVYVFAEIAEEIIKCFSFKFADKVYNFLTEKQYEIKDCGMYYKGEVKINVW